MNAEAPVKSPVSSLVSQHQPRSLCAMVELIFLAHLSGLAPALAQTAPKQPHSAVPSSHSSPHLKSPPVPSNTLETIRKQAAAARQRALDLGQAEASGEREKAENEAKSLKERAERMSAREGSTTEGPQAEYLRQQAAQRAEELQRLGSLRAARKEQESAEKAAEYQRQSESLQQELIDSDDDQHRGIKLNPVGTNLYIRNYSIVKPNVQPLRAQQQSLPSTSTTGQVASHTVHAHRTNTTNASAKQVSTAVQGQLLKQQTPKPEH